MDPVGQRRPTGPDYVALVLAVCLGASLVLLALGAATGSLDRPSERGTQIMAVLYGGIIGILGSYVGRRENGN